MKNFVACIATLVGCSGCVAPPTEYEESLGPKGKCVKEIFRIEEVNRAVCIVQSSINPDRYLLFPRGILHGEEQTLGQATFGFFKFVFQLALVIGSRGEYSPHDPAPSDVRRWRRAADIFTLDRYDGAGSITSFRELPKNRFEFEVLVGDHAWRRTHHYRVHGD